MPYNDYPKLLEEHYIRRVRETYRVRHETLRQIKTREQARDYVRRVRRTIRHAFGPLPARTPLDPRVVKTTDFGDFRMDCVLFESRPGLLVSANLYLPQQQPGPAPAALFTCGHSTEGKAYPLYVNACIRLAAPATACSTTTPSTRGSEMSTTA